MSQLNLSSPFNLMIKRILFEKCYSNTHWMHHYNQIEKTWSLSSALTTKLTRNVKKLLIEMFSMLASSIKGLLHCDITAIDNNIVFLFRQWNRLQWFTYYATEHSAYYCRSDSWDMCCFNTWSCNFYFHFTVCTKTLFIT